MSLAVPSFKDHEPFLPSEIRNFIQKTALIGARNYYVRDNSLGGTRIEAHGNGMYYTESLTKFGDEQFKYLIQRLPSTRKGHTVVILIKNKEWILRIMSDRMILSEPLDSD